MQLTESIHGMAGAQGNLLWLWSLDDTQQEVDHQVSHEQPMELLDKFGGTAIEQPGFLCLSHDLAQRGTAGPAPMASSVRATSGAWPFLRSPAENRDD